MYWNISSSVRKSIILNEQFHSFQHNIASMEELIRNWIHVKRSFYLRFRWEEVLQLKLSSTKEW